MKRSNNKITVIFTTDCEIFKKGDEKEFSSNIANKLVSVEKVAKFKKEVK